VYRLVNSLMHRERRCAAPARRATEAYWTEVRRKERNEAGVDAAALECQGICETVH